MTTVRSRNSWPALAMAMFFILTFIPDLYAGKTDPRMTGLPELTQEELEWQNKHMLRVKKVKLNPIGLERVNQWREKRGKSHLEKRRFPVSRPGEELEVATGTTGLVDESTTALPQGDSPPHVDNSQLKFFPPIRSQGNLNSCGVFNGTYYAMTHMYALANDLDAKTGGDQNRFSPKWTYTMVNGGTNSGTWYYWAYEIGQKHGAATWSEFPYDADYRAWNLDPATWESALYRRFDQYGYVANTHTDTGIDQVKQMLLNGYVLNIPTYIYSWNWGTISDDPSTPDDDAFAGKKCATWVSGTQGYHAMTVVGYNDDIWVDINGNQVVDPGEKGAFKIANSWGTGWGEAGFAWMAYDALKTTSAVDGGPSAGRVSGWYPARAHWVTAKTGYTPRVIGKFTLNHAKRDHLRITLGVSDISHANPDLTWIPEMIYNQGGALGFSGTTTAVDGTFVFDFTDILPQGGGLNTFYLGVTDDTASDPALVKSFTLIDLDHAAQTQSTGLPLTADQEQIYTTVDYAYDDGNQSPQAVVHASVLSGTAPLSVTFDGTASMDSDGSILTWHWDFGDGSSQKGSLVDHVYHTPGLYTATLTVTDDMGASDTASAAIEVLADPDKTIHIYHIDGFIQTKASSHTATVTVQITDQDLNPVPGAQVTGQWSGLISGETLETTGQDGRATFSSRKTRKTGTIHWTATQVAAPGHTWDPALDRISSLTLSTDQTSNLPPQAEILANPVTGTAPLAVALDGSGSTDTDGTVMTYEWDLGNGSHASGPAADAWYHEPGTYTVSLTVTDDQGAVDTTSVLITVTSGIEIPMHIADIAMSLVPTGKNTAAQALVTINDESGAPVPGVRVSGTWSNLVSGTASGTTDADGRVQFLSDRTKKTGTFEFTVDSITATGYIHEPQNDLIYSNAIDCP